MKLTITWKQARVAAETYVLIKYGVISDIVKWVRHLANVAGETANAVTNGINDIGGQISRTTDAINYQTDTVAANFTSADKSLLQMGLMCIIAFALLYRFGPVLYAMFIDSVTSAKPTKRKKSTAGKAAKNTSKEARFNKWVARYGGDFKTKKEAKQAFDAFERDMGY